MFQRKWFGKNAILWNTDKDGHYKVLNKHMWVYIEINKDHHISLIFLLLRCYQFEWKTSKDWLYNIKKNEGFYWFSYTQNLHSSSSVLCLQLCIHLIFETDVKYRKNIAFQIRFAEACILSNVLKQNHLAFTIDLHCIK